MFMWGRELFPPSLSLLPHSFFLSLSLFFFFFSFYPSKQFKLFFILPLPCITFVSLSILHLFSFFLNMITNVILYYVGFLCDYFITFSLILFYLTTPFWFVFISYYYRNQTRMIYFLSIFLRPHRENKFIQKSFVLADGLHVGFSLSFVASTFFLSGQNLTCVRS